MYFTNAQLEQLAWSIDAEGFLRHETAAEDVAVQARQQGVTSPLVEVLVDRSVPAPVRERAFGKVVHALVAARATPQQASGNDWALAN